MPNSLSSMDLASPACLEGEAIFRRGSVSLISQEGDALLLRVGTSPTQIVTLPASGNPHCTCGMGEQPCAHVVAALFAAQEDGTLRMLSQSHEFTLGQKMLAALSRAMPGSENVRLSPMLRLFPDGRVGLGLSIGQERMYAVRSIPALLACYTMGFTLTLSPRFSYQPTQMRFSKEDERLLSILLSHIHPKGPDEEPEDGSLTEEDCSLSPQSDGRYVILTGAFLHSVLRYLESHPFVLLDSQNKQPHIGIRTVELPLCFTVSLLGGELKVVAEGTKDLRLITSDARYVLCESKAVHLRSAQARVCQLLLTEGSRFSYEAVQAEEILATLLPALSTVGTVIPSAELNARLVTAPFRPRVYLDLVDGNVEARPEFWYGDVALLPFSQSSSVEENGGEGWRASLSGSAPEVPSMAPIREHATGLPPGKLLLRDGRAESALLDFFSDAGFVVRGQKILLRRAKDILAFCTLGVQELGKLCQVYASTSFERIKPRRFTARASFHMRDGRLVFTLLEESGQAPEIFPLLTAIRDRQHYVRLKTGEFLDIRDMAALAPIAQELLDAAAMDDPHQGEDAREIHFTAYRSAYMVSMLRLAGIPAEADEKVEQAMGALTDAVSQAEQYVPSRLLKKLVPYQRRGAGWLLSLYEAHMGGILADEMGLGKTVQVIAALSAAKKKNGRQKSIIVTPTSLVYHWLAEFKRFDESLIVRLVGGQREERRQTIESIKADDQVDVILTSYPLLRRDIDLFRDLPLRFAILDEAQFVKNAQSLGATAAKELSAQVRVALTGTPMENHTGELWSIFDFALPGYLGTQATFLRRYGGGERMQELQERIRPFLMRRLKKEVLSDLPHKNEQSLYAAMTPEQAAVYNQLLGTLRAHVDEALKQGALPKARMQVLSVLLKLRQVCCHPKLFLPDYEGTSGKLELLVQTVHSALAEKKRMLVFSQFVGMLQIIRKRLNREGVRTLYLDGETKPGLRQELCDRFNGGEGQVFLISLKAGGTGLNLTGANLVIHYDPWWNPATEDQATDRAHRIGQTRDVDVLRLIAKDTIEEKVTDLSKRKRAIFDQVVLAGETALSSLTEEDIRALFF
ncbi:MAG: DEAD/DEAH box helicase family protein [Clostridiales bacterium]|nr:DEAD/DEAH box helicase family protein [Clostridiales bacterium]